jgi:hypothetical protein
MARMEKPSGENKDPFPYTNAKVPQITHSNKNLNPIFEFPHNSFQQSKYNKMKVEIGKRSRPSDSSHNSHKTGSNQSGFSNLNFIQVHLYR